MAGVTINYNADPTGALDGTARVEDALDDLDDKLSDTGDSGKDAGGDLSDALSGAADSADDALDSVEELGEGAEGTKVNARSMGSVFKQVLEGDVAGAARAAVPLLSALGPAAAIAGVVAFAGLSLIKQAIEESSGAAEVNADDAARWAKAWIDAGGEVITSQQLVAEVQAIATDPERYAQAKANAADWGVSTSTAMRAMAGDATALAVAQQNVNAALETAVSGPGADLAAARTEQGKADLEAANAAERGAKALEAINAQMEAGREIAADTSTALLDIVRSAGTATREVDEFGNELYTLPDETKVVIDADTGLASQNLEIFKGDVDGIPETVNTKLVVDADTSAAERAITDLTNARRRVVVDVSAKYGRDLP